MVNLVRGRECLVGLFSHDVQYNIHLYMYTGYIGYSEYRLWARRPAYWITKAMSLRNFRTLDPTEGSNSSSLATWGWVLFSAWSCSPQLCGRQKICDIFASFVFCYYFLFSDVNTVQIKYYCFPHVCSFFNLFPFYFFIFCLTKMGRKTIIALKG